MGYCVGQEKLDVRAFQSTGEENIIQKAQTKIPKEGSSVHSDVTRARQGKKEPLYVTKEMGTGIVAGQQVTWPSEK